MSRNERNNSPPADMSRRRGSVTQATIGALFQRSSSVSTGTPAFPGPIATAIGDQRRRLSLSTGTSVGLSGTSPTSNFLRRASLSTNASEAIDENAVEEDDVPRSANFQRRMSFGAGAPAVGIRPFRGVPPSPGQNDQGFNWSDQLRSRAESLTGVNRPAWALSSPPRGMAPAAHERAKSVAEMPPPPAQATSIRPPRESRKPDAFQERILKGDFYMD